MIEKETKRIEVSVQDLQLVNMLSNDIENNKGVKSDNLRDIRIIGHVYTTTLKNEFTLDFDNESKFESDYKLEVAKHPKTTRLYFKDVEIKRLRSIDNTIKKCFPDSTYYRIFDGYVGMCSYLEFLEYYKPKSVIENKMGIFKKSDMKELEYIKKVLKFQISTETSAMYNIVPYPFSISENYLNDFDINQCREIIKHIEVVEKFTDKIKNATICFKKNHDYTETLLLCVRKDFKYYKAIDGSFNNVFIEQNQALNNDFLNNITFDETKSIHLSVLKNYILELSFENFNKMANYIFNHKLMIFENEMFTDPKTIKFQFVVWEQIIKDDFDKWLHEAKGFQRFAGVSYDGYLTMYNMYDFAKWYNENIQLQEKNNNEFREQDFKRVGLLNDDTNDKPTFIFSNETMLSFNKFDGLLWDKLDVDWFRLYQPKKILLKPDCTQRMFIYFFDKFLDKNLCRNPTEWLRLIFTPAFSYTNQHKEIKVLINPINKNDKKSISFNKFKTKIDNLIS